MIDYFGGSLYFAGSGGPIQPVWGGWVHFCYGRCCLLFYISGPIVQYCYGWAHFDLYSHFCFSEWIYQNAINHSHVISDRKMGVLILTVHCDVLHHTAPIKLFWPYWEQWFHFLSFYSNSYFCFFNWRLLPVSFFKHNGSSCTLQIIWEYKE